MKDKYNDKIEVLIKALEEGEKSGVSERTLEDIWKDVVTEQTAMDVQSKL